MRSRGIWLTVLMRGVQLNSLTPSNGGSTAPISYTQCYKSGCGEHRGVLGGVERLLSHNLLITVEAMFSVGFAEIVKLPKTLISQLKYSRC